MTGRNLRRWDQAVADLKALSDALYSTERPADRARLYEQIAAAAEQAARTVDPDIMPELDAEEGTSYAQVYADMARLARILAAGERSFGRITPCAANLPGVPAHHVPLWMRYLGSADRAERAEMLIDLSEATEVATGYGAASVLDDAARSERNLSGFPHRS